MNHVVCIEPFLLRWILMIGVFSNFANFGSELISAEMPNSLLSDLIDEKLFVN